MKESTSWNQAVFRSDTSEKIPLLALESPKKFLPQKSSLLVLIYFTPKKYEWSNIDVATITIM